MTKDIPVYKITIDPEYSDGEELGIEQIAFTSQPAVITKGMAFDENKRLFFSDDLKYRVVAPAMIPMQIYRKDDEDGEYFVSFDQTTIEQIHSKFMQDLSNRDVFNLEHDTDKTVPAYVLEAWLVGSDPKKDKAYSSYGIEVPEGTLMITAQVTDKDYYNELVNNEQIGFSIEGFLGLKLRNQLNKINMNRKAKMNALPDGEHTIEDKIYVVKDGEITEIRDVEITANEDEVKEEEIALEETVVEEEEEELEEIIKDEEEEKMTVDPAADADAILAIVQPLLTDHENKLLALIADLRNRIEEMIAENEEVVEVEATKLSSHQAFSKVSKFLNNNN
jgi:hypothetical protein